MRGKHRTENDSRLRKIRAALQRARQQLLGARKLAANLQQLAEVVIRRRVGRVGSERLLIGADRACAIADRFQRDAKIDMRLRIPGRERHGLAIELAGPLELTIIFCEIALGNQPVGAISRCGLRFFFWL